MIWRLNSQQPDLCNAPAERNATVPSLQDKAQFISHGKEGYKHERKFSTDPQAPFVQG